MEKLTSALAYIAAACLAWMGQHSTQDIAILVGAAVGVGTFAVNWYYRRKSYQLLKSLKKTA
ncbi:phage holin [Pseudomonas lundensis]|uniref:phage holin n=1 Tax=Serratia proteamaculans TaxID=28151 RepID=UPI002981B539|nr:phage holin [Serratia proteamaculans]MDW5501383.1 phage holin [Serratia proteamaculans]MDW5506448.1 phage holin [Pseudomonas lundensis]